MKKDQLIESGKQKNTLLTELNRLVESRKGGDFSASIDNSELSDEDAKAAALINEALSSCRAASEGDEKDLDEQRMISHMIMTNIVQNSPNFISYKKINGECIYVNPAASTITGFSQDELIKDYIGLMFGDNADEYKNIVRKTLMKKGVAHFEFTGKKKNGEPIIISGMSFLIENDAYATIAADVTDTKTMEETLNESYERLSLMLDASPICTQIWDRNLNTIDCNEAGVRLYGFKDKKEYTERFIVECSPEYQPDGQRSDVKAVYLVNKAFETGYCVFDWTHRMPRDGSTFPAEVTLVRSKYKDDDVVLGYTRDLREQDKMIKAIEQRDKLLNAVNQASSLLLTTKDNEDIDSALIKSMELIGLSLNVDRTHIWRNETHDAEPLFIHAYSWVSELGKQMAEVPIGIMTPFINMPAWESKFAKDECIYGPVSSLSQDEHDYFHAFDVKSIIIIPLFLDDQLWGLFSIDDCEYERDFTEDEVAILQSVSLMMASVLNRHALIAKRTQELALQTATLSALFDLIPSHLFTKDLDLKYVHANKAFLDYFGKRMEDIVGKNEVEALGTPEEVMAKFVEEDMVVINEGRSLVVEEVSQWFGEVTRTYEVTKRPLMLNDTAIGVLGIAHDITNQKESERKMAADLNRVKQLSDALANITKSPTISAGDLIAAANVIVQEGCIALNASRVSVWAISENSSTIDNISCYDALTGEFRTLDNYEIAKVPLYYEALKSERLVVINDVKSDQLPYELMTAEERPALCAMLDAPVRVDGKLVGAVSVDQDYCEEFPESRKWLMGEQHFTSSLADLMALAISGAQRRKAREEAEHANQAKSTFLANMSHEIRTPMNAIMGVTEIMIQNEDLSAEIEDGLDKIYSSCDLLIGVINDILDFSKMEAGKLDIIPDTYKVASLINDCIHLNVMKGESKPIEFETLIDTTTPARLVGDELRIKQVMNNLLSNAFKYTEAGKVTLSVSYEPGRSSDEGTLILKVRDTGVGMTKEQMDKMFEEYSRFKQGMGVTVEGTGLGLAITQRLITLMNGNVHAESEPNVGSLFTVELPQKRIDSEVLGAEVVENLRQFRTTTMMHRERRQIIRNPMPYGRVLIVDDVETNLFVAEGLMKLYMLKIETAKSGREAINKINFGGEYDIVFMDHMMPEMDGIETTKLLRASGYTKPIVALTANAVVGQSELFYKNGFDEFISKPIDVRYLNTVLNKFIRDIQPPEVLEAARWENFTNNRSLSVIDGHLMNIDFDRNKFFVTADEDEKDQFRHERSAKTESRLANVEIAGLDVVKGLARYHGDDDTYLKVLRSCTTDLRYMLEAVQYVSMESITDYKIKVHGMKGIFNEIYSLKLGERAAELENAAIEKDLDYINEHNQAFLVDAHQFIRNVEAFLSEAFEKNTKPKRDYPDSESIEKLLTACKMFDLDGAENAMAEIERYQYTSDTSISDWLREKVDLMNFSQIVEKFSEESE